MMRALVVVNGEQDWSRYLPGCTIHHRRLQTSRWLYHDGQLWVFDATGSVRVEAVLWRVGAIRPHPGHRTALELIRRAAVPCVNPAAVLLRGYDRLSMLNELHEAGLPVPEMTVALGEGMLDRFEPSLPTVVKVGNYHQLPRGLRQSAATRRRGMGRCQAFVLRHRGLRDGRAVHRLRTGHPVPGGRRADVGDGPAGRFWKANTATVRHEMVAMPDVLRAYTTRAMEHLHADMLGLDFLETAHGAYILIESNDTPGLAGFPDEARLAVASLVRDKINA